MDIEKLIEDLHVLLKQYGEKIPYGELVGAPWPYSRAGDLVWQDPEPYLIEQAIENVKELSQIKDILGDDYDLSRLRELVQADRDGRCVVLPVKIGDSIYFTFLGKIVEKQVFSVVTFCNSQRIYCNGTSEFFRPDDIEKTVFLTRESAEKALKGECNNEEVYKSNS